MVGVHTTRQRCCPSGVFKFARTIITLLQHFMLPARGRTCGGTAHGRSTVPTPFRKVDGVRPSLGARSRDILRTLVTVRWRQTRRAGWGSATREFLD